MVDVGQVGGELVVGVTVPLTGNRPSPWKQAVTLETGRHPGNRWSVWKQTVSLETDRQPGNRPSAWKQTWKTCQLACEVPFP